MVTSPAIADHKFGRHATTPSRRLPSLRTFLTAFTTAMTASAEYRRMNAMTDDQLAACGLTRADVARTLFEERYRN